MEAIEVYTDGGSRRVDGRRRAGWGVVAYAGGSVVYEASTYGGDRTNNQAEWEGMIHAARLLQSMKVKEPGRVYCDSKLVVEQANGRYAVKNRGLKPLYAQFLPLRSYVTATWVKAHSGIVGNERADALASFAIETGESFIQWSRE